MTLAASGSPAEQTFRVEVDAPNARETTAPFRWIEVKGIAGLLPARGHDVVIALDLSESAMRDSGVDVDEDGPDGRTDASTLAWLNGQPDAPRSLVQRFSEDGDFEDTVLACELEAAEALLERLDARRVRAGLVVFSDRARVVAPVGSDAELLRRAVAGLRRGYHHMLRGTHLGEAIRVSHEALVPDPSRPPVDRELSIVLLSDGAPTLPVYGDRPAEAALEAAAVAGFAGIRLFPFAIGPEAQEALPLLGELAALTGGRVERIDHPSDTAARLRQLDLAGVAEVAIENVTTGTGARAVRTFPDGTFDGFVQLAPGRNRIHISARSYGGELDTTERWVTLEEVDGAGDAERRSLLEELRRRTEETTLWLEMEERRRRQRRVLDLEPLRQSPADSRGVFLPQ